MDKKSYSRICARNAKNCLEKAKSELFGIGEDAVNPKTRILNAEYNMGQYNAYMEILGSLDFKEFARLHDEMKPELDAVLHSIERIYGQGKNTHAFRHGMNCHGRDANAAINILHEGLRLLQAA